VRRWKKKKNVEVGPRDGFQSVKTFIPLEVKQNIIAGLVKSGCQKIQVGSFVSPKAIPQMRDTAEITEKSLACYPDTVFFALVPNLHGAKAAQEAGLREVSPVISLSERHNMVNVKKTRAESLAEICKIREMLPELKITQDIATVFGCPFEGTMSVNCLVDLIGKLYDLDIRSFTLCDTVGLAYPALVKRTFRTVKKVFPDAEFGVHIHDTRNMGILNSYTAMKSGADSIQTAVGGMGGCPFAPGASGNTASEDFIYLLDKDGYDTGIDFTTLLETAKYAKKTIPDGTFSGHHVCIPESRTVCVEN